MERLYKKLERYGQSDFYPFHMPGHKRNLASSAGKFPFERDITEISGFDNLHHAEGILKEAQENAAQLYGTRRCFFSVNGSTAACCLQSVHVSARAEAFWWRETVIRQSIMPYISENYSRYTFIHTKTPGWG